MNPGRSLLVLLLGLMTLRAQEPTSLPELAERRLLESKTPGPFRDQAIAVLLRDREQAARVARELIEHEDWHDALTALKIWAQLGEATFLTEAIEARKLDGHANMAVRLRTLELMIGLDPTPLKERLGGHLADPLWLIRRAALRLLAAAPPAVQCEHLPAIRHLMLDPVVEVGDLARKVLADLAEKRPEVLRGVLASPWWAWESWDEKRQIVWSVLDSAAQGEVIPAELLRNERADPLSRLLDLVARKPSLERFQGFLQILRDPSHAHLLGENLKSAVMQIMAADESWLDQVDAPNFESPALERMSRALVPQAGRRLRLALIQVLARPSRESAARSRSHAEFEEDLLLEAFEQRPPGLALMLEDLYLELGTQGANMQRCRRVWKLRTALDVALEDSFLQEILSRGSVEQRVVAIRELWQRTDAHARLELLAHAADLDRRDPAREPILATLFSRPIEAMDELIVETLRERGTDERLRIRAVDAADKLGLELEVDEAMILAAPAELRIRLLEHVLERGENATELLRVVVGDRPLGEIELALLRIAARCSLPRLDLEVRMALEEGRFDPGNLAALIEYLGKRFGDRTRRLEFDRFLERALDWNEERRARTGYANLDGKVLEYLLNEYDTGLPLRRLFGLSTSKQVREQDRVVQALADLARKRGETATLQELIRARWTSMKTLDGLERVSLAREMLHHGGPEARRLVEAEARQALEEATGQDLMRDGPYNAAILLEWVFHAFVEAGDDASLILAVELLGRAEDRVAEMELRDERALDGFNPRSLLMSTLVAEWRRGGLPPLFRERLGGLAVARSDPSFWLDLARQLLRFPDGGELESIVAEGILSWSASQLQDQDHLLRSLGVRLLNGAHRRLGARLYDLGLRLNAARLPSGQHDVERFLVIGPHNQRAGFWALATSRLLLEERMPYELPALQHRRFEERRFLQLLELQARLDPGFDLAAVIAALGESSEPASFDQLLIRAALDDERFEEARVRARRALQRIAVFGSSPRHGKIKDFSCLEAAALWGLGDREGARALLKRSGVESLEDLEGARPDDFN